ncbi:MAG TPA: pentapeptide repeat-containing protein, partial [Bacillota bacterium]|nr:pentapeptide repeat-containing protein [Bacillota bacterium]
MNDEQLSAVVKPQDDMEPLHSGTRGTYYVLAECEAGRENRIVLKDLKQQLPLEKLRQNQPEYHDETSVYVEAEGSFYPDYLEENGVYLVSVPFYEYLNNTLRLQRIKYNHVGICTEKGERIEEYCLLVPQEIDCILNGSARYDKNHSLVYFEIDETKVGKLEIFRVKGFPHLIVTQKLNRIDFAGYQCTRLENFFDYVGERKRCFQERYSGQRLETTVKEYERRVEALGNPSYKYGLQRVLDQKRLRQEIVDGLREIFDSYHGTGLAAQLGAGRCLSLFWPWEQSGITLVDHTDFERDCLNVPTLEKGFAYLKLLPEVLQGPARKVFWETVIYCLIQEGRLLDHYQNIHGGKRLALVLETDYFKTTNPPLLYEYQPPLQREMEATVNFSKLDLNSRDFQGFDFSGKNLSGLKFFGCNLQRANFNSALLEQ